MPELVEVEAYRRAAERAVGRTVASVSAPDPLWIAGGVTPAAFARAVRGVTVTGTRRIGKLLLVDTDGPVVGIHFGMTGRIWVDGSGAVDELVYSSKRDESQWDRLVLRFADGGALRVNDPRRLGRAELDPDEGRLGPDAARLRLASLRTVLAGRTAPLKAVLMDQRRVAGLGNLLTDEALWFAGLAPARPGGELDDDEVRRLHRAIGRTLRLCERRGGSHTGDLFPERHRQGVCPQDGTALRRDQVGGRTTYWCPEHQV